MCLLARVCVLTTAVFFVVFFCLYFLVTVCCFAFCPAFCLFILLFAFFSNLKFERLNGVYNLCLRVVCIVCAIGSYGMCEFLFFI